MKQGGPDWLPNHGVRCNNCFMYFEDDDDVPLIHITENGSGWEVHGCPVCKTDEYLMDAPGYEGGFWHTEPLVSEIGTLWSGFSELFEEGDE